jgi:hypothetical protein
MIAQHFTGQTRGQEDRVDKSAKYQSIGNEKMRIFER